MSAIAFWKLNSIRKHLGTLQKKFLDEYVGEARSFSRALVVRARFTRYN